MCTLAKKEANLVPVDISKLPISVYLDTETNTIVFESEYDIVFKSSGNIVTSAKKKQVILGEEVHLNPKTDVINTDKQILR